MKEFYKNFDSLTDLKKIPVKGKVLFVRPECARFCALTLEEANALERTETSDAAHSAFEKLLQLDFFGYKTKTLQRNFLQICVTNRCNLRCQHCFMAGSDTKTNEEMNPKEIEKILQASWDVGFRQLKITGGEPMMRKDPDQILIAAQNFGFWISMNTNGVADTTKFMKVLKYLHHVQVSLDGVKQETNDSIRGHGTFKKILNAVSLFCRESTVAVDIAYTRTPWRYDQPAEIENFFLSIFEKLPKVRLKIGSVLFPGREISESSADRPDLSWQEAIAKVRFRLFQKKPKNVFFPLDFSPGILTQSCGFADSLFFAADGKAYPCGILCNGKSGTPGNCLGDIREHSLQEISYRLLQKRTSAQVGNTKCKNCYFRFLCGGGCKIKKQPQNCRSIISEKIAWFSSEVLEKLLQ